MSGRLHNRLTVDLFGGALLPEVAMPRGFIADAEGGVWFRFCHRYVEGCWFNAAVPASWTGGYSE